MFLSVKNGTIKENNHLKHIINETIFSGEFSFTADVDLRCMKYELAAFVKFLN
jgi:hypothetical protein